MPRCDVFKARVAREKGLSRVFSQRLIQPDDALFAELEGDISEDRFAHGRGLEDRILVYGNFRGGVSKTKASSPNDIAVVDDGDGKAWDIGIRHEFRDLSFELDDQRGPWSNNFGFSPPAISMSAARKSNQGQAQRGLGAVG